MIRAITGAHGFLGWHVRAAARATGSTDTRSFRLGDGFDLPIAAGACDGADELLHIAGVSRASDDDLVDLNVLLARQAAQALVTAERPPARVIYAGTTQAGNGSPYAVGKERAADILRDAAESTGSRFVDVRLPNVFGESGRPGYNSVVATFAEAVSRGRTMSVVDDRELTLLHAQDAADVLLGAVPADGIPGLTAVRSVSSIRSTLAAFESHYRRGEIPTLRDAFERDLFNTYRSHAHPTPGPFVLHSATDSRGSFTELVRAAGCAGQTSFSTTAAGVVRGQHVHRRKIERFIVVGGSARIRLRRLLHHDVVTIDVTGEQPVAVDIPTLWAHSIENTGTSPLSTVFWCADLFDPTDPDTSPEQV